jgi:hypothetical protein
MTRSHVVKVRLSDLELQALLSFAGEHRVTVSGAIRLMIALIPEIDTKRLRLVHEVEQIKTAIDRNLRGK